MNKINAIINFPFNNDVLKPGDLVTISGTASGPDFKNYKIEWATGFGPLDGRIWSSSGIILSNDGNIPVEDNPLGKWNTSFVTEPGFYTIKL